MKKQTVQEVAKVLDVNPESVRRWAREVEDFPSVTRTKSGAIMLDLAAVKKWHETRLEDREMTMADPEYIHWRARRMKAMALAAEHENLVQQASLKTGEVLKSHLEKCVRHVLSELATAPYSETWDKEFFAKFEGWRINLRSWLQTEWFDAKTDPASISSNPLPVITSFRSFCSVLLSHSGELANLPPEAIRSKLSGWINDYFHAIATGNNSEPAPGVAPQSEPVSEVKP